MQFPIIDDPANFAEWVRLVQSARDGVPQPFLFETVSTLDDRIWLFLTSLGGSAITLVAAVVGVRSGQRQADRALAQQWEQQLLARRLSELDDVAAGLESFFRATIDFEHGANADKWSEVVEQSLHAMHRLEWFGSRYSADLSEAARATRHRFGPSIAIVAKPRKARSATEAASLTADLNSVRRWLGRCRACLLELHDTWEAHPSEVRVAGTSANRSVESEMKQWRIDEAQAATTSRDVHAVPKEPRLDASSDSAVEESGTG